MEELNKYRVEIMLCYYSQNNIKSFTNSINERIFEKLSDIALSIYLNDIIDRGDFITEEDFYNSFNTRKEKNK